MVSTSKTQYAQLMASFFHYKQKYGDYPYMKHIKDVVEVANKFIHIIPEQDREDVICAANLHDVIEDSEYNARKYRTYDINSNFGERVLDICLGVTDFIGSTRKERHCPEYWERMRTTEYSVFVKLCDRIANIQAGGKISMYLKENTEFLQQTYRSDYDEMYIYMAECIAEVLKVNDNKKTK